MPESDQSGPVKPHTESHSSEPHNSKGIPPWRWAWIGFALAAVVWFGSSLYYQKAHQYLEIEYQAGNIETVDYETATKADIRASMYWKIGAGILCLASLTYLVSQIDIHRPRRNH